MEKYLTDPDFFRIGDTKFELDWDGIYVTVIDDGYASANVPIADLIWFADTMKSRVDKNPEQLTEETK